MGVMIFQLPPQLAGDDPLRQDLERASVAGGQDNMPYLTDVTVEGKRVSLTRGVSDSGSIQIPWRIAGAGNFMTSSATLMERATPYALTIELARGKINQVRGQAADWQMGGLPMTAPLQELIRDATLAFGHALLTLPDSSAFPLADLALQKSHQAAHELTLAYIREVFRLRHEPQPRLETQLSCRIGVNEPAAGLVPVFSQAFNTVTLPFAWRDIEPKRGKYDWTAADRRADWATAQGLKIIGGPLIDFGGRNLPDWLWESNRDLNDLSRLLGEYIEVVARRYQSRIRAWQISSGTNCAGILARRDDELIWLTLRLAEAARRVNPTFEIIVGLAHPWGDYLVEQERLKTPFVFADDLMRMGLKPTALDLELIMGVSPRGSYCRDLLDTSRLLDLYALLGVPVQVTLGYPSAIAPTEHADSEQRVNLGHWRTGYSDQTQADWAAAFTALALCKPYLRAVQWSHWSDAEPHPFPNCGLVDAQGRAKPALAAITSLRAAHLK